MAVVIHGYISARGGRNRVGGRSPKLVAVGRALAHVKYIQHRPGDDRETGGREFFDELEEHLDGRDLRKAIKENGDSKVVVHKLTLAPEIDPLDKRAYTRELMRELAGSKGQDLKWMAIVHENTAHHHIHVVVLGKDKNGRHVRFDKEDYAHLREWGDRYLQRWQPIEFERARAERRTKERERFEERSRQREAERAERINEGLELPWMHRKVLREQYEPYSKWSDEQKEGKSNRQLEKTRDGRSDEPYFNDSVQAAGKEWSKKNTLSELRELNAHLWDHPDERLPLPEYKKLVAWIKEKERLTAPERKGEEKTQEALNEKTSKQKDHFEYQGHSYSKSTKYEKLTGLANKLRQPDAQRLPIDDYQKLRSWIETADRARWAGAPERQLEISKKQFGQRGAAQTSPNAIRFVDPLQQQMMSNPVVGLFMQGASIANELVKWIDLRDNRDPLMEAKDGLEAAKKDRHQNYVRADRTQNQKQEDQEAIDKLDKAIEENKEARKKRQDEKKRQHDNKDRGLDYMR